MFLPLRTLLPLPLVLVLAVTLASCDRVDIADLPPIPPVYISNALPDVNAQIQEAVARIELDPADASANGHLAMVLQTYKQFSAAEIIYQRARALDPNRFEWAYLHGVVLRALGRPGDATSAFQAALRIRDDYILAHIHVAETLADQGKLDLAASYYERALSFSEVPSEAHFSVGRFLVRSGDAEQAIPHLKEALRLSGNFGSGHYQLGIAYRDSDDLERAEHHLRLAERHHGTGADGSDIVLNQLLLLNRSDQPFIDRAKRLAEAGRPEEADRFLKMALERNPDSLVAHINMIALATSQRDFAAVEEHVARASALAPGNAKVYFNLGVARIAQSRFGAAMQAFERSLQLDDQDPNTHVQIAILRHQRGELAVSEQHLRDALSLDPRHQLGNWLLGELLTESNAREAIKHLRRAVEQPHERLPQIFVALAKAEMHNGDPESALRSLDAGAAAAEQMNDPEARRRIARLRRELSATRSS